MMKAKLIKERFDFYGLKVDSKIIATNIAEVNKMFNYPFTISLKNCQAVENGYDLDELACKEIKIDISVINHIDEKLKENPSPCTPLKEGGCVGSNLYNQVKGFQKGFQKALEILGDKKFSESDVREAIDIAWHDDNIDKTTIIQSLQQTEWDVEICCYVDNTDGWLDADSFNSPLCTNTGIPKLDAEGCLILKRI